ncbi:MAG: cyclic-phosphate processing receiver domain-containing protein [Bacteroidota bacterium]
METKTLLWLDDYRDPNELKDGIKHWLVFSPVRGTYEVHWVKDYKEFTGWITKNGLPTGICFDHDLSDFQAFKNNYPELMSDVELPPEEKTGMDCAKWLVDYCIDNNQELPLFTSQSGNPVGRENILTLLTQFEKQHVVK